MAGPGRGRDQDLGPGGGDRPGGGQLRPRLRLPKLQIAFDAIWFHRGPAGHHQPRPLVPPGRPGSRRRAIVAAIEACRAACEVNAGKPGPLMLEAAMELLGLEAGDWSWSGTGCHRHRQAVAAGMPSAVVLTGEPPPSCWPPPRPAPATGSWTGSTGCCRRRRGGVQADSPGDGGSSAGSGMSGSGDRLRDEFEACFGGLAAIGQDPAGGWTRLAWTDEDRAARSWFESEATARGLTVEQDPAGNLWAWWTGSGRWVRAGWSRSGATWTRSAGAGPTTGPSGWSAGWSRWGSWPRAGSSRNGRWRWWRSPTRRAGGSGCRPSGAGC